MFSFCRKGFDTCTCMCIFKELRVVFGVFISPTLRHVVIFVPQKMQETHFYVHMSDAQKHL